MKIRDRHLSLSERHKTERWRQMKLGPDEMARRLGRHRSTIFRELRRNYPHDSEVPTLSGCWCIVAQSCSERRTRQRKLVRDPGLRDQAARCLPPKHTLFPAAGFGFAGKDSQQGIRRCRPLPASRPRPR